MVDIFIKQTKTFIENSGLRFKYHVTHQNSEAVITPNRQSVTVFVTGTTLGRNNQEFLENHILQISTLFLLFDVYLDSKYEQLVGKGFAEKYKKLPLGNDVEIIQKEIYGVLIIFRNALTHDMGSINVESHSISIDRVNSKLQFNFDSLENIFTAIIMIIYGIKNYREECYLKYFYQEIVAQVKFVDGCGRNVFLDTTDTMSLKCNRLESKLDISLYCLDSEKIVIKHHKRVDDLNLYDYIIEVNGEFYQIPEEVLIDKKILIENIQKWKI